MKAQYWQRYLAEFFGTFVLVFVGSAAVVGLYEVTLKESQGQATSPSGVLVMLAIPFAFGIALLAGLYAFAETSGGHFNPAVSLAMFLDRRLSVPDLAGYWISQFAGAILASGMLYAAFDKAAVKGTTTAPGFGRGPAVIFEIVLTAIFVLVILQVTKSGTFGSSALVAIPLTLVAIHFAAVLVSGSSVNPARTLGPAVIGNKWTDIWIYFLGPAAGAILGWLVHTIVVEGDIDIRDNVAAVIDEVEDELEGGGAAVSDDQPEPAAPEWGTETESGEPTEEDKT
jgi:aquaporin Z